MTQEELKQKIQDMTVEIQNLIMDGGVMIDTALYGYLHSAEYLLTTASMHTSEFLEEFSKIHIKNSRQEQV